MIAIIQGKVDNKTYSVDKSTGEKINIIHLYQKGVRTLTVIKNIPDSIFEQLSDEEDSESKILCKCDVNHYNIGDNSGISVKYLGDMKILNNKQVQAK